MRMIETEVERRMEELDLYEVAQNIDIEPHIPDIAEHMNIDASDIAGEFDVYEVAENIELSNIVQYLDIDAERMAKAAFDDGTLCKSEMVSEMVSEIDMDDLATLVADELLSKTGYGWCHPEFFDEITNRVKVHMDIDASEVQP
jgi:hypothetical protein